MLPVYRKLTSLIGRNIFSAPIIRQTSSQPNIVVFQQQVSRAPLLEIKSDIKLKINSVNLWEYPDVNTLLVRLFGCTKDKCSAAAKVQISEDKRKIQLVVTKTGDDPKDVYCHLAVPFRAKLAVEAQHDITLSRVFGDSVRLKSSKSITTNDLRVGECHLRSDCSDIICKNLLLAEHIVIETGGDGNVNISKLEGHTANVKTNAGNISTNASYVDAARFETNYGYLSLLNMHKKTDVYINKCGGLKMIANGNINVCSSGGNLSLQISKLAGENFINAQNCNEIILNITERIMKDSYLEVSACKINLHKSLDQLKSLLKNSDQNLEFPDKDKKKKLYVSTEGAVTMKECSWTRTICSELTGSEECSLN